MDERPGWAEFVIEVGDETAPTVDCGDTADISPNDASVDFTATTSDNCGSTPPPPSAAPRG